MAVCVCVYIDKCSVIMVELKLQSVAVASILFKSVIIFFDDENRLRLKCGICSC